MSERLTDVRAAAERLRLYKFGNERVYQSNLEPFEFDYERRDRDRHYLADAYLADSDPTPITPNWLKSVGAVKEDHPSKWAFHREDALDVGLWLVDDGWKAMLIHHPDHQSCLVRGLETRGDVRLLCRALGIPTERKD